MSRESRYQEGIADCDADIIAKVEALTDPALVEEALARSGLSGREFAEDVLLADFSTLWRWTTGVTEIRPLTRRFLMRELIRARHRARHGSLPASSWCAACGRGQRDERPILHVERTSYDVDSIPESSNRKHLTESGDQLG